MEEGKFKEIKRAVEQNKNIAEKLSDEEDSWGIYDSSIRSFALNFYLVLPKNAFSVEDSEHLEGKNIEEKFREYIENTLKNPENPRLTAVEFGGPGSAFFSGFSPGFFARTAGVCLKDLRTQETNKKDEVGNHFVIEADVLDTKSNRAMLETKKAMDTNKVDLLVSRMYGPLGHINMHPAILDRIIRTWYGSLNQNGLMFIQFEDKIPSKSQGEIELWADLIREKFPQIEIEIKQGLMRIHKKSGAPEELPPSAQL